MADKTRIEWTATVNPDGSVTPGASWNPIRARVKANAREIAEAKGYRSLLPIIQPGKVGWHCEHVSPGCDECYAETGNERNRPVCGTGLPYDRRARDLLEPFLHEETLMQPLRWKRPRRIFPCSMTDWCAEFVTDEMRDRIVAVAALCPQHQFLFLTKRARKQREYVSAPERSTYVALAALGFRSEVKIPQPLPNAWLGVSAEDQQRADERIVELLHTPAAVRFVSLEPLLGPIDLKRFFPNPYERIPGGYRGDRPELMVKPSWVICGGESGSGARPCDVAWIRSIIAQCREAAVPVFCKQVGRYPDDDPSRWPCGEGSVWMRSEDEVGGPLLRSRKGGDPSEWPSDLRVREMPEASLPPAI